MFQILHYTDSDITFPYIYSYVFSVTKYVSNRSCEWPTVYATYQFVRRVISDNTFENHVQ